MELLDNRVRKCLVFRNNTRVFLKWLAISFLFSAPLSLPQFLHFCPVLTPSSPPFPWTPSFPTAYDWIQTYSNLAQCQIFWTLSFEKEMFSENLPLFLHILQWQANSSWIKSVFKQSHLKAQGTLYLFLLCFLCMEFWSWFFASDLIQCWLSLMKSSMSWVPSSLQLPLHELNCM